MVPPIWPDELGRPLRTSAGRTYRVESYVNWCGHGQEVIPIPRPDGLVALVPVLGEAS